jgi:hypothetical protein
MAPCRMHSLTEVLVMRQASVSTDVAAGQTPERRERAPRNANVSLLASHGVREIVPACERAASPGAGP